MKEVTLDLLLERAQARRAVANCSRCGGTGKFATVDSPALTSSYGQHCFKCGDAYKLPRQWTLMTASDIAELLKKGAPGRELQVIEELAAVGILDGERQSALRSKFT